MFSISDFSLLARVPCRALKTWQAYGLLRPVLEDASGRRSYSTALLPRVNRIMVMRELGFELRDIARMIDAVPLAELRGMVLMRRCNAIRLSAAETCADHLNRLHLLESRIAQIEPESPPLDEQIRLRRDSPQQLLCTRETVTSFAKLRSLVRRIADGARTRLPMQMLGNLMVISHAREFDLAHLEVQIGFVAPVPIEQLLLPDGRTLRLESVPAATLLAACTHTGLAEHAHLATARLGRYIEANGYCLAGPGREVLTAPDHLRVPEQAQTEMQFPITRLPQTWAASLECEIAGTT